MKARTCIFIYVFTLLFFIGNKTIAQSPDFVWKTSIGGQADDQGKTVLTDPYKNVYTVGTFQDIVDFDPGPGIFSLTSFASNDIFILKLDSLGNFLWVKQIGGVGDDNALSFCMDASGNIYIAGDYNNITDFDPGTGVFTDTSTGYVSAFILKLNNSGDFVWVKSLDGNNSSFSYSITLDSSGNVYSSGVFRDTVDFDPGTGIYNLVSNGFGDGLFILKLDSAGNFIFAKGIITPISNNNWGSYITIDNSGNIFMVGNVDGSLDFDPGPGSNIYYSLGSDLFILKLSSAGTFIWVKTIGGLSYEFGNSIVLDKQGNIYTTGEFDDIVDFDPGIDTFNVAVNGFYNDNYILKLDNSGNFIWVKTFGGTEPDHATTLAIDNQDNIYSAGSFQSTVDFDPGIDSLNITSYGAYDMFISKFDSSGNFIWTKTMGGQNSESISSLHIDASGNLNITGSFSSPELFCGTDTITNVIASGSYDIFIAKLDTGLINGNFEIEKSNSLTKLFPNPATDYFNIALPYICINVKITVFDISGKIIYSTIESSTSKVEINTENIKGGIYFVQIQTEDFLETNKLLIDQD